MSRAVAIDGALYALNAHGVLFEQNATNSSLWRPVDPPVANTPFQDIFVVHLPREQHALRLGAVMADETIWQLRWTVEGAVWDKIGCVPDWILP